MKHELNLGYEQQKAHAFGSVVWVRNVSGQNWADLNKKGPEPDCCKT